MPSPSLGSIALPADPVWTDEFDWTPVSQTEDYGITGGLLIQQSIKLAGRPITLDVHWLPRAELLALIAIADAADTDYTLVIPQGTYTVMFRRPPYTVTPHRPVSDPADTEWYDVILNLMTV